MATVIRGSDNWDTADAVGPSFRATMSAVQNVSSNVATKCSFDTETWDTNGDYNTTLYRFTPSVAGYYHFYHHSQTAVGNTAFWAYIYKNGSSTLQAYNGGVDNIGWDVTGMLYMNGTSDYVEAYAKNIGGTSNDNASSNVYFEGYLARGA
tara:strand:- start:141 stop:593 length:453 start_codon:yes stop_codon:yes gene_type:complete